MKTNILYICLAGLIIFILLIVWIAKEGKKIQPVSEKKIESVQITPQAQKTFLDYKEQVPVTSDEESDITIIKQPGQTPNVKYESDEIQKPNISSAINPDISRQDTEAATDELDSGNTEIKKHPSEAEVEDMKTRGVVAL